MSQPPEPAAFKQLEELQPARVEGADPGLSYGSCRLVSWFVACILLVGMGVYWHARRAWKGRQTG